MNTKTKEGARNKGNPYFLRVPWHKGGLVNTGPDLLHLPMKTILKDKYDFLVIRQIMLPLKYGLLFPIDHSCIKMDLSDLVAREFRVVEFS